jgi:D-alanyl-lipoteichoic acid acyltransferase DltB (MBOAT superfamily)
MIVAPLAMSSLCVAIAALLTKECVASRTSITLRAQRSIGTIILPLGISFITFQKIAFLVDVYRAGDKGYGIVKFGLFVTFFPQLIAGPIVHHAEFIPQIKDDVRGRLDPLNLTIGLTIFIIGLLKKIVIADTMASYSTPAFTAAEHGVTLTFIEAWGAALGYTLQLYFDFFGYTDMAIGLARMFGFRLPLNFFSPYKAGSIIEFWRRWHMTLSRFLRDYLYVVLGGNRKGHARRFVNLFLTMLIGGIWHGAGWTFVVWGALHGVYLTINHAWRAVTKAAGIELRGYAWHVVAHALTFTSVVVAWVFFRAASVDVAIKMLRSMAGANGFALPVEMRSFGVRTLLKKLEALGVSVPAQHLNYFWGWRQVAIIAALLLIVWIAPNTTEIMARFRPGLIPHGWRTTAGTRLSRLQWRPQAAHAIPVGMMLLLALLLLHRPTEFIYFQF